MRPAGCGRMDSDARRFWPLLGAVLAVGFVVRLVYALAFAPPTTLLDDDTFFHLSANLLADGHGYIRPLDLALGGHVVPTAEHPPLYPGLLALVSWLGGTGEDAHRIVGVLAGTATVLIVALITRRLAGDRAAIIGAVIAALFPCFVAADGSLMSGPLLGLLVGASGLQALRALEGPTPARCAALGALIALATLARSEALLLLPLLAVAVARGSS